MHFSFGGHNQQKPKKANGGLFLAGLYIVKIRRKVKKSRYRRFILEEWITTEQSYGRDVTAALQLIKKPMMEKQLIGKQQCSILFPQFEGMIGLSKNMVETIASARKEKRQNMMAFGDQLNHFASFYKLYGTYFGCRLKSEKLLREITSQHPQEMRGIEDNLRDTIKRVDPRKENMTINDCLQQPQYRMFKYVLLLKDYLKKLPKYHRDYQPLQKALATFESINLANNELMQKLQGLQKKTKLDKLFGKSIGNSSEYIVEMGADTIYFPSKLYIFNNLVIVSIAENMIFKEEKRYTNLYLNEFSFIRKKPDLKYYKNSLLLCGQYEAIHFFLPDAGSRQQIVGIIEKVVLSLKGKGVVKRQQKLSSQEQPASGNKLSFALDETKSEILFSPEFQIEVLSVDIRPLGALSNDTVYITRFMLPSVLDDELVVRKEEKPANVVNDQKCLRHLTINQYVEVHLSQLMQLHKQLKSEYPGIQFPEIDPLTKEINLITEGKKNTKTFEVRRFLMEEFFNFIFRHPMLMKNPLWLIKKYKLIPSLWSYTCEKNEYLNGNIKKEGPSGKYSYRYGEDHCDNCKKALIKSIEEFEFLRRGFQAQNSKVYCFNFYNLIRLAFLRQPMLAMNSLDRVLLYSHYAMGRIDYVFIERERLSKIYYVIKVGLCVKAESERLIDIFCDYRTKAGEVLADLAQEFDMQSMIDYRLVLLFGDKERVIDQDEVIFDIIKKYELTYEEQEDKDRESRISLAEATLAKNQGFFSFSFFKDIIGSKNANRLVLKKAIFLSREVQVRAIEKNPARAKLVIDQLFFRIAKSEIPFEVEHWGELSALFYVIHEQKNLGKVNLESALSKVSAYIIPEDKKDMFRSKIFYNKFSETINEWTQKGKTKESISLQACKRCLRLGYESVCTYSYFVPVTAKIVPDHLIVDAWGKVEGDCFLGVNSEQLVVLRNKTHLTAAIRLPLQDVEIVTSTFSIFIHYNSFVNRSEAKGTSEKEELRFDSKMLFGLAEIFEIYKLINNKFPQRRVSLVQ